MSRPSRKIYRNGKIHVLASKCPTCIFRPGNLMDLSPGRVKEMVEKATGRNSCIVCHSTLGGYQAVCRGFYDKYKTQPLQLAERLGLIEEVIVEKD